MLFDRRVKYNNNLSYFNQCIDELISEANTKYPKIVADCMPYLKPTLDQIIKNSKSEFESWDDKEEIRTTAYKVIFNLSFDLLSSGEMHIYYGELNPLKPGMKFVFIVHECLSYFATKGYISNEEAEEQKVLLSNNIKSVG